MASLNEIENHLNIEIGDRVLRDGRKKPNKNQYYRFDDYLIVKLTQDKYMIVSNSNAVRRLLRLHSWHGERRRYAITCINNASKAFHQLYLNYEDDLVCDHINRKRFDNRFENLRIVSYTQNNRNKTIASNNTTGHTGISEYKKRNKLYYRVLITDNNNKRMRKCFSIDVLGREEALRQAIEQRRLWVVEFGYDHQ